MDPAMPRPTARMTPQSSNSAGDGLSVSCAIGLTGVLLYQISGYGPEAADMAESTDQLTGASSALTWAYSCTGRTPVTAQAADGHEVSRRTGRDAGKGSCQRPRLAGMWPVPPAPGSCPALLHRPGGDPRQSPDRCRQAGFPEAGCRASPGRC
jgi:hypothetical protein